MDANAAAVYDFFGVKPKKKIEIDIIPTKQELDEIYKKELMDFYYGLEPQRWLIGFCPNGRITYLSINDYKNTSWAFDESEYDAKYAHYLKTIVHEFVHIVNRQFVIENNGNDTHKCFSEGIATVLSKQKEEKTLKFIFPLDRILWTDKSKSCYDGWYLVTKYFVENYDHDFVLKMMKDSKASERFIADQLYDEAKKFYTEQEQC